jgi:hypothetical protein
MNAFIKLFVIVCCGDLTPYNTYTYQAKCINDKTEYTIYSPYKYNSGDTLIYKK